MTQKSCTLIDATLESKAPFFAENPIYQSWLRSFNDIKEALQLITQITLPYSIIIFLSRDNLLDDGLPSDTTGQTRTLIKTLEDLKTIHRVHVYCPTINTDIDQQILNTITDPRLVEVWSSEDLEFKVCTTRMEYLRGEISRCTYQKEEQIISIFNQELEELMKYVQKVINDRKQLTDDLVEQRSDQPGQETS